MPRRAAPPHAAPLLLLVALAALAALAGCAANPDAKRLYDDLLSNYNKLVRPVLNVSDALTVRIKLKLSQLIDVVGVSYIHTHSHIINLLRILQCYASVTESQESNHDDKPVGGAGEYDFRSISCKP